MADTVIKPIASEFNFETAFAFLGSVKKEVCQITELFLNNDHWQNGSGWVGWLPDIANQELYNRDMNLIYRGFTFKGIIKSLISRLVGAVGGKEPDFDTVDDNVGDNTQTTSAKQIDKSIVEWWEEKKVHNVLQEFIESKAAYGKACLRFYIPAGLAVNLNPATWQDALKYIYIENVHYKKFESELDPNFGTNYVVIEVGVSVNRQSKIIEVHYQDEQGQTCVTQYKENDTNADKKVLDLKRKSLCYIGGDWNDAMITPSIHSQQKQINHAETMESFALHNINFPETVYLNADLPTKEVVDPKTKTKKNVLENIFRGVGTFLNLVGMTLERADGGETMIPADVKWRESADPKKFRDVSMAKSRNAHEEAGMLYVFLADNPYPSGDSRVEAMTDYLILLKKFETLTDKAGLWILQTVYEFANWLAKDTAKPMNFLFKSKLTLGKLSTADRQLMLQELTQNVRSRRNYQIEAEITDNPAKEDKAIKSDMKEFPTDIKPQPTNQPNKP